MRQSSKSKKEYIVGLDTARSKRALVAAIVVSAATFVSLIQSVINLQYDEPAFHYFTNLSNLLSAAGAMLMLPYAVEGIRKKRFSLPRWISLFQYAGAVSVFITMFCACTIILFTFGPEFAFEGPQKWLHLIAPILAIVLFLSVETGQYLTRKDTIIAQLPFWGYSAVYTVMVVVIGKERGGWTDMYQATSRIPFPIVVVLLFAIGYGAAAFLRVIHNRMVSREIEQLSACWDEDITPVEMKIEAFGLGRYMGRHLDESEIVIPMDVLKLMAEKCGVPVEDLAKAYVKGVTDSMK